MKTAMKIIAVISAFGMALQANALNILLTNDDGWDSTGIQTMKAALVEAGHTVTLVAPLTQQSGKGGGLSTDVFGKVAVVQAGGEGSGEWSVDSTPADAVRAALGATNFLPGPIDLVISGINEGQNLGMPGTWQSGTINAALQAMHMGLPAIAISAERLLLSDPVDTLTAMPAIADFMVTLVQRLDDTRFGGQLLPSHTILNVNYPVFNAGYDPERPGPAQGVKVTNLALKSNLEFVWSGRPQGRGEMTIGIDGLQTQNDVTDPVANNDTDGMKQGFVTVSMVNGNMNEMNRTTNSPAILSWRLWGLAP